MAQHVEINPDNESLPFSLGLKAVRLASTQKTHKTGTIRIPTSTGKDFIAGKGAEDGANWIDEEGNQTSLVDTSEIDKSVEEVKKQAEDLSQKSDDMAGQITDIKGTVNGQQTQLTEFGQKLEGEITRGDTTVKSVTELKQTVTGISATVEQTTQTADAALDKASKAEQNADGIRTEVSEKYQTKDGMTDYATKSFVDQTAQSVALGVVQDYKGADGSGLATKSEVNVSKDNIALAVQGRYEGDDESLKDIQSSLNITRDKVTIAFSNAEAAAKVGDRLEAYRDSNDTNVGDLSERLDAEIASRQSYIQFGQDANNPVMEMGATSSTARMRLTNTQLQFLVGSVIAAYLSNDQLYINNANVLQTLRIGKYAFVPRSDGHMSLKYVG